MKFKRQRCWCSHKNARRVILDLDINNIINKKERRNKDYWIQKIKIKIQIDDTCMCEKVWCTQYSICSSYFLLIPSYEAIKAIKAKGNKVLRTVRLKGKIRASQQHR